MSLSIPCKWTSVFLFGPVAGILNVVHKFITTTDRRKAIAGAEFAVNTTRIGGLDAFNLDVDIPLTYGVDQCVGDTLCVGGIMCAQRNIPQILAFCKDIRAVAAPDFLFMNYANPMAMNTWAALH